MLAKTFHLVSQETEAFSYSTAKAPAAKSNLKHKTPIMFPSSSIEYEAISILVFCPEKYRTLVMVICLTDTCHELYSYLTVEISVTTSVSGLRRGKPLHDPWVIYVS